MGHESSPAARRGHSRGQLLPGDGSSDGVAGLGDGSSASIMATCGCCHSVDWCRLTTVSGRSSSPPATLIRRLGFESLRARHRAAGQRRKSRVQAILSRVRSKHRRGGEPCPAGTANRSGPGFKALEGRVPACRRQRSGDRHQPLATGGPDLAQGPRLRVQRVRLRRVCRDVGAVDQVVSHMPVGAHSPSAERARTGTCPSHERDAAWIHPHRASGCQVPTCATAGTRAAGRRCRDRSAP
jgi:hypothetical protein